MRSCLTLVVVLDACARAVPPEATGAISEETFRSELVDDDYVLRIREPAGGEAEALFPLIIQLDPTYAGLREFEWTTGLLSQHAAAGDWPEAVVVGVDYPDPRTRERDYRLTEPLDPAFGNDGADLFYRVLAEEILPHVEERLPVDPAMRVLVGHSNGAVFGWYAAFRHEQGQPSLFAGVVAADGGLDQSLFTCERWHAERADTLPIRLYASRALYNGAAQQVVFEAMAERLRGRDFPDLQLRTERFDTDHGGVLAPSFEAGLDFIFSEGP